jgi:hypothetical protein
MAGTTRALAVLVAAILLVPASSMAAEIIIENGDPPGWGLNDPRPFTPVAGNHARTLGEARLKAAQHAADIWGRLLQSQAPIVIRIYFSHDTCGGGFGLANSGYPDPLSDFDGSRPGVRYPPALANAIAGRDLNGNTREGSIEIMAVYDDEPGCLGKGWYYGFDHPNNFPKYGLDFVAVILHELGHVLGFSVWMQDAEGAGSAFTAHMYDETLQRYWAELSPEEREASAARVHQLTWNGPAANAAAARYPAVTTNGHLRLDAGHNPLSHWEAETSGGRVGLMMTGSGNSQVLSDHVDVTVCALVDMGWTLMPGAKCPDVGR